MKRIVVSFLLILYLGTSSGAAVHFHYCMEKLVSWSMTKQSGKLCDFCKMPLAESKKKSCCKEVKQHVKVESSQKVNQTVYKFDQPSTAIILPEFFVNYQAPIPVKIVREALSNAPPDGQRVPVYLKNCTYRI